MDELVWISVELI